MSVAQWSDSDSQRAKQIWIEYLSKHDVSDCLGRTAGIDPHSGRIWFGDSIRDIVAQRDAEGLDSPLFFQRIGSDTYYRKGRH